MTVLRWRDTSIPQVSPTVWLQGAWLSALLAGCATGGGAAASPASPDRGAVAPTAPAECRAQALQDGLASQRLNALLVAARAGDRGSQERFVADHMASAIRERVAIDQVLADMASRFGLLRAVVVCRVEYETPHETSVLVARKQDPTPMRLRVILEQDAPHGILATRLQPVATTALTEPLPRLSASERRAIVERLTTKLADYIYEGTARQMQRQLRTRLAAGAYDHVTHPQALARLLTVDLRRVSKDGHLSVSYVAGGVPEDLEERREPTQAEIDAMMAHARRDQFGFARVDVLEGNIGYIDLRVFHAAELASDAATEVMSKVAGTRALIVDLRRCEGGEPSQIAHITSYLFGETPVHLNDLYFRAEDKRMQFFTKAQVPGKRFGPDKPVYVLTSGYTYSGGEEFAYNLQTRERATIIGATTGGGAHPVYRYRIDDHMVLGLPVGRAINPVTGTNWEGVGVTPDIELPAAQALEKAMALIAERQ